MDGRYEALDFRIAFGRPTRSLGTASVHAGSCATAWITVAENTPNVHGHTQGGAAHVWGDTAMPSECSHAPTCRCCPELAAPAERPSAVVRPLIHASSAARIRTAECVCEGRRDTRRNRAPQGVFACPCAPGARRATTQGRFGLGTRLRTPRSE